MIDPFAAACRSFAAELARLGIDPHRVTIVLEPDDVWTLRKHALRVLGYHITEAINDRELTVEEITFLAWRQPRR